MLSNWAPRAEGGQRRNPGIYSANDGQRQKPGIHSVLPSPKRSPFESVENSGSPAHAGGYKLPEECPWRKGNPQTAIEESLLATTPISSLVSRWGYPETLSTRKSFPAMLSAKEYDRKCGEHDCTMLHDTSIGITRGRGVGCREITSSTLAAKMGYYGAERICHFPYSTHDQHDIHSAHDQPDMPSSIRSEHHMASLRYGTQAVRDAADKTPVHASTSKDWKRGQCSDDESQTESPSTIAPDTDHGNSSDSDCPAVRQVFSSDDVSSDSDIPVGGASLEPPSSDDNLSSSDEAAGNACVALLESPCSDDNLSSCDEVPSKVKFEEPPSCCRIARNYTQSAKHLTKQLGSELRDLETEMGSLTHELMAIKRMIPTVTPEGDLVFSTQL